LGFKLNLDNVLCLGPSVGFFNIKTDAIPFRKALVALHVDGRVMDEQVLPLFTFDKTITLVRIKPLYYSLSQSHDPLSHTSCGGPVPQFNQFRKGKKPSWSQDKQADFAGASCVISKIRRKENPKGKPLDELGTFPHSAACPSTQKALPGLSLPYFSLRPQTSFLS
jgi:hypothetical protein